MLIFYFFIRVSYRENRVSINDKSQKTNIFQIFISLKEIFFLKN
jgi:hypothetical protein